MVTDATKKSRKAPPAASPGKRKPRKPQRGPEASPLGAGSEELPNEVATGSHRLPGGVRCRSVLVHRPHPQHIRVSQHMQFSRSQVYEKIRRLKQKFEATVTKMRSNHPGFIKPHDQAMFELSQKIWTTEQVAPPVTAMGNECTGVGVSLPHPYLRDAVSQLEKESAYYAGAGSITKGFQLLKPSEAEKLEERWRAHCSASMKIFFETCKLKNELLQACIQALESHTP
ncbi:unnamed protein product [Spirodela intermedia]|uniref:Glabrous enhancer-binding protein-like DBD domain-containing protein n=1 Tax=Spirodela intermedia TaxID=51605 RepID=A0A7I8IRC7_SPIIN|nr:unnamed protein product [Spirodela intermedia]CAA6659723.1 unnamed protein product [Spirodela intermedia]